MTTKTGLIIAEIFTACMLVLTVFICSVSCKEMYTDEIANIDSLKGWIVLYQQHCILCDGLDHRSIDDLRSPDNKTFHFTVTYFDYYSYEVGDTIGISKRKAIQE